MLRNAPTFGLLTQPAEPRLEVGPVGTYTDFFLECIGGRARCPNLALASMGYQCMNGQVRVLGLGAGGLAVRAALIVPPAHRSAQPHPRPLLQLTACCATAKAHDCQPVYKIADKEPKNWEG